MIVVDALIVAVLATLVVLIPVFYACLFVVFPWIEWWRR